MAVQPDPPIQLDPSMDSGHQLAFINQNFQSIANVLGKQSFNIVSSGICTISAFSVSDAGAGLWASNTSVVSINHGLSYIPQVIAYVNIGGQTYIPLEYTSINSASTGQVNFLTISYTVDTISVNFGAQSVNLHTASNLGPWDIKYYLLQLNAN